MTTEEEFFKAFGIEPKHAECRCEIEKDYKCNKSNWDDADCPCGYEYYPPITPEIVLKLIKILLKSSNEFHISISKNEFGCDQGYIGGYYEQTFEQSILSLCIEAKDEIQDQVRGIFNE